MTSIPIDILIKIEEHHPDLASLIYEIMVAEDSAVISVLEKKLATTYLERGASLLTDRETSMLAACCQGRRYGELDTAHRASN